MPTPAAVSAIPAIIISQVIVAAAARRSGAVAVASSASRDVPAAPTPAPISTNDRIETASAAAGADCANITVPSVAPRPPSASTAMPPMIQGVRAPPASER